VRLVDEFTKLVAIDSPSYSERQMGDYVKNRLSRLGMIVIEDDAGEKIGGSCGNIYGYLKGAAGAKPLLFCAHLDTVEPSSGKRPSSARTERSRAAAIPCSARTIWRALPRFWRR
jgi:tripeptide aminopeptidase